ncbi:MAG TPA: hypothetical protein VIY29_20460 [Ktedonobacteraceae bacterium]
MNIGDVASKFIDPASLFSPMWRVIVHARTNAYLLPFLISKRRLMLTPIPLTTIENSAPIIVRSKGGIELIACHGINRINVKKTITKALTASTIASSVDKIGNFLSTRPSHAQLTDHPQTRKCLGVMFRRHFGADTTISEGDISIVESLSGPLTLALTRMLCQHIRKVRSERRQDGQLKLALWCRIVNVLRERDKCCTFIGKNTEALQCHHDVTRPAI